MIEWGVGAVCPGQAGVMDAVCWLMLALFPPHLTNKTISQQAPARAQPQPAGQPTQPVISSHNHHHWTLSTLISTNVLRYISFHSYCCINCSIRAQPGAHIPGMVHVILSNCGWNGARVRMRLRWNKMSACPPVEVLRKLAGHSPGLIPHNETQLWLFTGPHYKGLNEAFELKSTDDYT